jgi:transposase
MNVIWSDNMIPNFQQYKISSVKQQTRIAIAEQALGKRTVERLLAFSSYLFGYSRKDIAETFNYTIPGLSSLVQRIHNNGVEALMYSQGPKPTPGLERKNDDLAISTQPKETIASNIIDSSITIIIKKPLIVEVPFNRANVSDQIFIMKCQQAGIFSIQQAADILNKTSNQVQNMKRKLKDSGGVTAVIDQRRGQQQYYKFSQGAQSELLYCFIEDLIENRSISSIRIHQKLINKLDIEITDRMIRNHLERLGLLQIKTNLVELAKKKIP